MSDGSISAPLLPVAPPSTSGVGLGYGIAIAVGILVLVSTIMLASYVCVRVKGGPRRGPLPVSSSAARSGPSEAASLAVATSMGLDRAAIEAFYPKFVFWGCGGAAASCSICLAEYDRGEILRRAPECGHCFHAACVGQWLRVSATCPLCRSSPVLSAAATPAATPMSELIPLASHARQSTRDLWAS